MTPKRPARIRYGIAIACGLLIGILGAHVLHPEPTNRPDALGALPNRHLQPPWWQAVLVQAPSPGSVQVTVPADVLFATNSSTIDADGLAALQALVPLVARATSVTIAGCTDAVGGTDSPYNVALSEFRALAAENEFVSFGMNRAIFHTVGWADTHPIPGVQGLDGGTIDALNRRIVIILTEESP